MVLAHTTRPRDSGRVEVAKRVVVVASGETERRALPHLVRHLEKRGISLVDIRIPPRGLQLSTEMVERLIKAAWFADSDTPPDKFVVVVDVDQSDPAELIQLFKVELPPRLPNICVEILFAYAQQHLEAWYFANAERLRAFLGRSLGSVDASKPDEIPNPKLHLKHLLGTRVYTARVSEDIARSLDPNTIAQRSPSFGGFLEAVIDGGGARRSA